MINNRIIEIAKIQGSLFEYSCKNSNCSSSFFIKQFLYSNLAKHMSNINFVYSNDDVVYLYNQLNEQKKLTLGKNKYSEHIMYWIGYLLAVISLKEAISPEQIYKIIKPEELFVSYEAYHSLDIEESAERIIQSRFFVNKNNLELFKSTRS